MKIGILTNPIGHNYGGILQNYALQKVLKNFGYEPITLRVGKISYFSWLITNMKIFILKLLGRKIHYLTLPILNNVKNKKLLDFISKNIECTKLTKWFSKDVIFSYDLDVLIVGSDQVWRPCYNIHIEDLFLSFVKDFQIKKISYAASFGTDKWEFSKEETDLCKTLISKFDAVSVREDSGIKMCNDNFNINAVCVLDPTLLLQKNDYLNICKNIDKSSFEYLLVYMLDISESKLKFVNEFAERNNFKIKLITPEIGKNVKCSVESWLASFRDAKFIITDSFHGTIFSILFNIEFYSICNIERGSSRFISLLSKLGLESRLLYDINLVKSESINWMFVNSKLDEYKQSSLNFLNENLNSYE